MKNASFLRRIGLGVNKGVEWSGVVKMMRTFYNIHAKDRLKSVGKKVSQTEISMGNLRL